MFQRLRELAGAGRLRCAVAWSGGLDSTLLLHLMLEAGRAHPRALQVRAIHVDHGLQAAAVRFRRFCQHTARDWRVPLQTLRVRIPLDGGESVEEAARNARRAALTGHLHDDEWLVSAQHADDQLETLLLALARGAGPKGLAGMPARASHDRLLRPLLAFDRAALEACARRRGLAWIEDPTNADLRHDRNYLRVRVLPLLRERWPALARTAARSARHSAVAAALLENAARADALAAADGAGLDIAVLRRFSTARRAAVLRTWIVGSGARAPNERHLQVIETMMAARADAHPQLRLPDCTIRRRGGRLLIER